MSTTPVAPVAALATTDVVGMLPPTAEPPSPPRRVGFARTFLGHWLLPARFGPHLAAGSLGRAFAAHAISLALALAILTACVAAPRDDSGNVVPLSQWGDHVEHMRVRLAEVILSAAIVSAGPGAAIGTGWPASAIGIPAGAAVTAAAIAIPGLELLLVLLAAAFMPLAAGGDAPRSVWRRSLRNVYWSSTAVIPTIGVAVALWRLDKLTDSLALAQAGLVAEGCYMTLVLLLFALPPVLWVRMIAGGARNYVGSGDGPAFRPREPRCDDCGYVLLGLPIDGICPECSLPVRESLPGGRRRLTDWHHHELSPRGFVELIRHNIRVLRERAFFRCIPVHSGLSAGQHFAVATGMLMALAMLGSARLLTFTWTPGPGSAPAEAWATLPLLALLFAAIVHQAAMLPAALWAQSRLGVHDYRVAAATCYYATPWAWPMLGVFILAAVVSVSPLPDRLAHRLPFTLFEHRWDAQDLLGVLLLLCFMASLALWWSKLKAALHCVRFANV